MNDSDRRLLKGCLWVVVSLGVVAACLLYYLGDVK